MSSSVQKNILITGSTSGIGLETAKYLCVEGYNVLLVGRNEEKLKAVSEQVNKASYYVCDLEDNSNIANMFEMIKQDGIKLDGMFHAAGCSINMPIRTYKEDEMRLQMQVNYFAFMELCKNFCNRKISNDGASIVAMSSLASMTKLKGSATYAASKSALNVAVSVAAKEYIKRLIRVNALLPAYVDTRMSDGLDDWVDVKTAQPLGIIPPVEISYMVEFLMSDKSKHITGALIPISAGMEA